MIFKNTDTLRMFICDKHSSFCGCEIKENSLNFNVTNNLLKGIDYLKFNSSVKSICFEAVFKYKELGKWKYVETYIELSLVEKDSIRYVERVRKRYDELEK